MLPFQAALFALVENMDFPRPVHVFPSVDVARVLVVPFPVPTHILPLYAAELAWSENIVDWFELIHVLPLSFEYANSLVFIDATMRLALFQPIPYDAFMNVGRDNPVHVVPL